MSHPLHKTRLVPDDVLALPSPAVRAWMKEHLGASVCQQAITEARRKRGLVAPPHPKRGTGKLAGMASADLWRGSAAAIAESLGVSARAVSRERARRTAGGYRPPVHSATVAEPERRLRVEREADPEKLPMEVRRERMAELPRFDATRPVDPEDPRWLRFLGEDVSDGR